MVEGEVMPMPLLEYRRKRDFTASAEPRGKKSTRQSQNRYVIQKHDASRLHYDFRLEMDGVLKSWAVPKGVPFQKGEKRLAVEVEDHPLSYIDFEGTIPKGQYGGGTVMVWDRGTFSPEVSDPAKSLANGKLHFTLAGKKLRGEWYLVRTRADQQWLLIKGGHDMKPVSLKMDDTSAKSGRSMRQLGQSNVRWESTAPSKTVRVTKNATTQSRVATHSAAQFIPPMLALPVSEVPKGNWDFELKLDGYRALLIKNDDRIQLLSRNKKDLRADFPEIVEAATGLRVKNALIDGEIVAVDEKGRPSFQLLQARDVDKARPPILYFAFDLLHLNGVVLKNRPLKERKKALEKIIPKSKSSVVRFSPSLSSDGNLVLNEARKHGLEGLIGKRSDSIYEPGRRSGAWVKLKIVREQEVVIGGYTKPEGARQHFGALLVGVYVGRKLQFTGKVGTGFTQARLQTLKQQFDRIAQKICPFANLPEKAPGRYSQGITSAEMKRCHWLKPVLVCQVRFQEWTRDGKLRAPVFLGLRDDKAPREVRKEPT